MVLCVADHERRRVLPPCDGRPGRLATEAQALEVLAASGNATLRRPDEPTTLFGLIPALRRVVERAPASSGLELLR
jgi:hypothetical protein